LSDQDIIALVAGVRLDSSLLSFAMYYYYGFMVMSGFLETGHFGLMLRLWVDYTNGVRNPKLA